MSSPHAPQDEPFNHETLTLGHKRGESSTNLLEKEGSETTKYDDHDASYKDSFYDNAAPSKPSLYDDDVEHNAPRGVDNANRTSRYQDLGTSYWRLRPSMNIDVNKQSTRMTISTTRSVHALLRRRRRPCRACLEVPGGFL